MILQVISDWLAGFPANPVTVLWTVIAIISLCPTGWLYLQAVLDARALSMFLPGSNLNAYKRVAGMNLRWSRGRFITAGCFTLIGLVALTISPAKFPTEPLLFVKNVLVLFGFLFAEYYLLSSSISNLRDRSWLSDRLSGVPTILEYNTEISRTEGERDKCYEDIVILQAQINLLKDLIRRKNVQD